jgi:hypothetical protein
MIMTCESHYQYPLIALTQDGGDAPEGELISIEGNRVSGRLLGVRIWPGSSDVQLPNPAGAMAFFYVQVEGGQMMVPLDQIASIRLVA